MYSMPRHIYSNLIYACWFVFCIPNLDVFRQCSQALMISIRCRDDENVWQREHENARSTIRFFRLLLLFFCVLFCHFSINAECSQQNVFHLYKCCIRFYSFPWIINLNHLVPYRKSLEPSCVWIFRLLGFFFAPASKIAKDDCDVLLFVRHFLHHPTTLSIQNMKYVLFWIFTIFLRWHICVSMNSLLPLLNELFSVCKGKIEESILWRRKRKQMQRQTK